MSLTKQPEALRLAGHLEQFRSFPDDLAAAVELLRRLHVENESLREQIDWVQIQPDEYEREMEAILQAAKNSYRRHMTVPRGQVITRGDAFESHCVWAALQYAEARAAEVVRNKEKQS